MARLRMDHISGIVEDLVGGVGRFEDVYLLTYVRGPSGLIVALAEDLR